MSDMQKEALIKALAERDVRIAELEAQIEAVKREIENLDRAFDNPHTASHEAYRLIRSVISQLRQALQQEKDDEQVPA